jgi:predicted ATPase
VPTVAQAIGFSFYSSAGSGAQMDPRQQLLDYLRQKRMLLLLDNFEHLMEGAQQVTRILEGAPGVKVLVTSRVALRLEGEHLFPVGGMGFPESPSAAGADASQHTAVELFVQVAHRARPSFELTDENLNDVVQVCRLVDGLPLGIRLAAAWVEMLTPSEIAVEIGRSLDFLETDQRDVPERQRSIRAAVDHSWQLLTARERGVMEALSVFRGGFTREAAQRVSGASLRELRGLVSKSLLQRAPAPSATLRTGGRYEVHELLRQYAQEKLDQEPAAGEAARERHCVYYTAALQRWEADLKGPHHKTALAEMDVEIENVRAAWDWAVERGRVERLDRALEGLCHFWERRWRYQVGEAACRTAASRLASVQKTTAMASGDGPALSGAEGLRVLARILAWQANFSGALLSRETVIQLLRQSLAILEGPELAGYDTRAGKAFVLLQMGKTARDVDPDHSKRLYEQSLALYRAVGDRWWTAILLEILSGIVIEAFGAHEEAEQLAKESLTIGRALGSPARVAKSLMLLGWSALFRGQVEEAERLLRESIPFFREISVRGENLGGVAWGLEWLGQFEEAHSIYEESLALFSDRGSRWHLSYANASLALEEIHLGQYEQARVHGQMGLASARELDQRIAVAGSCFLLGRVALAEEAYPKAWRLLEECVAVARSIKNRESLDYGLAVLGYAARGLGQLSQAERRFSESLRSSTEVGSFVALILVLPGISLLLADRGDAHSAERAVELYALASRYPVVANSRWFEDIAGRHIATVAATLPPEVVATAQKRGRALGLWETAEELLVELRALGWAEPPA